MIALICGLYISGHPLEKLRNVIEEQTNINTLKMKQINESEENSETEIQEKPQYRDGQIVKIVGIVNSVKKKYTKTNKIMAFVTIEDLYGQCELIVFENCYQMSSDILLDENVVLVEGRLSIREDEDVKIVANKITEFNGQKAAIGILVAVLHQVLVRAGREDQAMMTTLAGLVIVLTMVIKEISTLFETVRTLFNL